MNYEIKSLAGFDKSIKALIKKYPSFKNDLINLRALLRNDPQTGIPLGNSCYKIRISISGKNKGKSGGARVITHIVSVDTTNGIIYLLALYDKAEQSTISDATLKELLKEIR